MKRAYRCQWSFDGCGWWYPSCRDDVRSRKRPAMFETRDYCPLCGLRAEIAKHVKEHSAPRDLCPCCGMRLADRRSGFCVVCEAKGYAGEEAARKAAATIRARRAREARRAS